MMKASICDWCKTNIDLDEVSGTYVECDEWNLCRPCYNALMDGTPEEFKARNVRTH